MSKYTLDFEYEFEFELIGIASALPGYKIAWHINKMLDISLHRVQDHVVKIKRNIVAGELSFNNSPPDERRFSRYKFENMDKELGYDLISYKCQGKALNNEIKGYDYLLKIESPTEIAEEHVAILKEKGIFNMIGKIEIEDLELDFLY